MSSHADSLLLIHLIEFMSLNSTSLKQFGVDHIAATHIGDKGLQSGEFAVVCHVVIVHQGQALTMKCNRFIANQSGANHSCNQNQRPNN